MTENQKRSQLKIEKNNFSIVAGAGAGKTTLLSERISNQIKDGAAIESFAIITYTNVAAAELREKITGRLIKMLEETSLTSVEKENVEHAIVNIDLLQISTIHSFLLKLLKEHCVCAGLAVDVEKLEEAQAEKLKQDFFDRWYNSHSKDINDFRADWRMKNSKNQLVDRTYEVMRNMFMDIASLRETIVLDTHDYMGDCVVSAIGICNDCHKGAIQFGKDVEVNVPIAKSSGKEAWSNAATNVRDYARQLAGLNPTTDEEYVETAVIISRLVSQFLEKEYDLFGYNNRENHKVANDRVRTVAPPSFKSNSDVASFATHYDRILELAKINRIITYVMDIQKAFQTKMDEDVTVITDDDILYRAKKLLTDNADILEELRKRYTNIYLDEAQDTTAVQLDVIKLLAGKPGSTLATFELKDNNLIIVGDPKQSIYRFTGAQKEIYDAVSDDFDAKPSTVAQKVILDANFRSNERIVEWVNTRFWDMIKNSRHEPMTTDWQVSSKDALSGVYYYKSDKEHKVEEDVKAVVDIIKSMVDNPNFALEEFSRGADPKKGEPTHSLRQICYSDFLIITKKTPKLGLYVEEFEKQGIPVQVHGKFDISEDVILKGYVDVLDSVANGKSKLKAIQALQVVENYVATDVNYDQVLEAKKAFGKLRVKLASENMSAGAIAHYIARHEELYVAKNYGYDVNQVKSFRKRIHQMIDSCMSNNDGNLANLVEAIKEYMNTKLTHEMSMVHKENAVRLMNVHKSKGLTGNIVIIADRRTADNPTHQGFISGDKYYPSVRYATSDENPIGTVVPSFMLNDTVMSKATIDENAEQERLAYVAATRAAHALIFMPIVCDAKGNFDDGVWFQYCENSYPGYEKLKDPEVDSKEELERLNQLSQITNKKNILEFIADRNAAGPIAGNQPKVYQIALGSITKEQLNANLADISVSKDDSTPTTKEVMSAQLELSLVPSGLEAGGSTGYTSGDAGYEEETERPKGRKLGNVLHRSCELIVRYYPRLKVLSDVDRQDNIRNIILKAIFDNREDNISDVEQNLFLNYLCPKLDKYFLGILAPILEEAKEAHPEYEFSFFVPEEEVTWFYSSFGAHTDKLSITKHPNGIWVNGQADLVVKTKQGDIKIYDYKSDSRNGKPLDSFEASLKAKYQGQLKMYRYAISKAFVVDMDTITTELIHLYML